jgi:hypothetical protein
MRILVKEAVPLVDDDDERTPRLRIDILHTLREIFPVEILDLRIGYNGPLVKTTF